VSASDGGTLCGTLPISIPVVDDFSSSMPQPHWDPNEGSTQMGGQAVTSWPGGNIAPLGGFRFTTTVRHDLRGRSTWVRLVTPPASSATNAVVTVELNTGAGDYFRMHASPQARWGCSSMQGITSFNCIPNANPVMTNDQWLVLSESGGTFTAQVASGANPSLGLQTIHSVSPPPIDLSQVFVTFQVSRSGLGSAFDARWDDFNRCGP